MNDNIIEEENYRGYKIEIYQDITPENPRTWDNLGILLTAHREYTIGEIDLKKEYPEAENWNDIEKAIIKEYNPVIMLPVYMYDHSVLRFKIGSFDGYLPQGHAEFDSGKIGYIIATREKICEEYGVKRITKKIKDKVIKVLKGEIDLIDDYGSGAIFSYVIEKDNEIIDSCSGFYGELPYQEAREVIDAEIEHRRKEKQRKLKALIQAKVNLFKRQEILL